MSEEELGFFLSIIMYMGLVPLPGIKDYWTVHTRVSQVLDFMSRDRSKSLYSNLHFNDNDQATG